jgi:ATPase family associated with various cellular activities (AAA)
MSGYFKVSSITDLDNAKIGDKLSTSDFATLRKDGKFLQMEYVEESATQDAYKVKPGVFSIAQFTDGLKLVPTSFTLNKILKDNKYVKNIVSQVDKFFAKKDAYKKYGFDVPKRGWLLWGRAGTGKSSVITEIIEQYTAKQNTLVVVWPSDKIDPYEVKTFIKRFEYHGVENMILVIEDLGGVEVDQIRIKSMSSLLSLLDNVERTFTISTAIIATTNFPENFLANITNRPQRFDTKIEVKPPTGDERVEFLNFFSNNIAEQDVQDELRGSKYKNFTPAHVKEILMRAELNDLTMLQSLKEIQAEIEVYEKLFVTNKGKLGILSSDYDD